MEIGGRVGTPYRDLTLTMTKMLCDKIFIARPRSSVDRVSASGAEERSSSLRGGALSPPQGGIFVAVKSFCEIQAHFIYYHRSVDDQ